MKGKIALVTGGSRGIGRAIALKLAEAGCDVAVFYAGRKDAAEETVQQLQGLGVRAICVQCDVSDENQVAAAFKQVCDELGLPDILVNNAGIVRDGLAMRMSAENFRAVLDTNLTGAFNMIHACLPGFLRRRSGRIINISSVSGMMGNAGQANYAASKAGLIALAKSIAQEVGSRGIRANAIAPGFIETAMTAALPDNVREEWVKKIPLRRGGQVDDIANVAVFLASDMSGYVTGQVIQVDGGMNM